MLKHYALVIATIACLAQSCKKENPAPLPIANFFVENSGCTAPCQLIYFDASENAIKWRWEFGNGTTSSNQNDTILFDTTGTYETWLYIWNSDNVKDSIRKNVIIN